MVSEIFVATARNFSTGKVGVHHGSFRFTEMARICGNKISGVATLRRFDCLPDKRTWKATVLQTQEALLGDSPVQDLFAGRWACLHIFCMTFLDC
jgi:hypothetical protein